MSRIGRKPIVIPEKVKVTVHEHHVVVEGPLGKLEAVIPQGVAINIEHSVVHVVAPVLTRSNRGFQGLMRANLANMIHGVLHGYEIALEINGVGYKVEAKNAGLLVFSLGYTHTIELQLPDIVKAVIDKTGTKLVIKSIRKDLAGQYGAQIRGYKPPEPYKGKGVKYVKEIVRRKQGKAGSK